MFIELVSCSLVLCVFLCKYTELSQIPVCTRTWQMKLILKVQLGCTAVDMFPSHTHTHTFLVYTHHRDMSSLT